MKPCLVASVLLVAVAAAVLLPSLALAASPRAPQVPVVGPALQNYVQSVGEYFNVSTDQLDVQVWTFTISGNSAMTLQLSAAGPAIHELGLYNSSEVGTPPRYPVLPAGTPQGWFALVSPRTAPNRVTVTLFDADGVPQYSAITMVGLDPNSFGFYIRNQDGSTGYSQDARQTPMDARVLTYAGSGVNAGCWWLCFEDNLAEQDGGDGRDFDDAVMFVESVNPTPVSRTTWGNLKSRFR